jgi:hypothetical protein
LVTLKKVSNIFALFFFFMDKAEADKAKDKRKRAPAFSAVFC